MSFGGDLERFRLKAGAMHEDIVRGVEIQLFSAVIMDSPVDTGRFRGNWQASTGVPLESELEAFDPQGTRAIGAMTEFVQGLRGARVTWLANNLPYAERLEYGWSRQAPQGMVRRNIARFQRIVDEQAAKHR